MKLILHIGTPKTGTTSIQHYLNKNRLKLTLNRIYVPLSVMTAPGNHRWIPVIAYNNDHVDGFTKKRFKNKKDREEKINDLKYRFATECKDAVSAGKCDTLILTSEHCHARLREEEEIERLYNFFKDIFDEIKIVIYIRDPLKMAVSRFSEGIKSGNLTRHLPAPTERNFDKHLCNHAHYIDLWSRCFRGTEILVRRFERNLLVGGDVVTDFCSSLFPDLDRSDFEDQDKRNESMSLTGMALIRKMNFQFPYFINNKVNPMRGQIVDPILESTNDGSKFLPCKEEFSAYNDAFAKSNEKVRARYFPEDKSLFPPQQVFSEEKIDLEDVEISPSLYEKVIAELWKRNRQIEERLETMQQS